MAYTEPTVRHALISLGFLYKNEPGNYKHARSKFATNHQSGPLLIHYNKSVRCLVDRISEPSCPPELALVTCLLFVCIEFLRGNYVAGFTHLTNGLKIIAERQQKHKPDAVDILPDESCSISSNKSLGPSTMIEDKIIPMFIRSIASALMYGVEAETVFKIPLSAPKVFGQKVFTTLQEAQETYFELRNATLLLIRQASKKFAEYQKPNDEDFQLQNRLLECHRTWLRNLELLEGRKILSKEELVSTSALRVSHYSTFIYLSCALAVRQELFDAYLESFKQILCYAKVVIDSQPVVGSRTARFTFEVALIAPLYFVATRCRCPVTRREAVSLLGRGLPREGLWDAEQEAIVSKRLIEMEETEVDPQTGWPLERARIWSSVVDANMDKDGGFWVAFLLSRYVGELEPEVLNTKITWERMCM